MGGHLLSNWGLPEKRVPRAEFNQFTEEILSVIQRISPELRAEIIPFFAEKQDFGDMDLLVEVKDNNNPWLNTATKLMTDQGIMLKPHKNGNVISFPYKGFQVDFITVGEESFDAAKIYFAYESGNFMGRIADKLGFKYGHKGLWLHVPLSYFDADLPCHEFRDIQVTKNPIEAFELLGFDFARFQLGFQSFEKMAIWVAESRYFAPQLFAFDSLNSINRTRNRKRPVYAKFVEWCERQPAREIPQPEVLFKYVKSKYPHISQRIVEIREDVAKQKERREKFNGNLVKENFGYEGAELGKFIVGFKTYIEEVYNMNFNDWLDTYKDDEVRCVMFSYNQIQDVYNKTRT